MTETPQASPLLSEILKTQRKAKALTLEMVSERLKLTKAQLEYFESPELDLAKLNSFQRGYLRNYAEVLSVNIKEFESQFPVGMTVSSTLSKVGEEDSKTRPFISPRSLKWLILAGLAFVAVILVVANQ